MWLTFRNYGFSDAADLFVFISGYSVAFVYAKVMREHGFIAGTTRLLQRAWQIYVAYVFLFVIYVAAIGYLAQRYNLPQLLDEYNVRGFTDHPFDMLSQGLLLKFKPVNLDVLPLYIALMVSFPPILWLMTRKPNLTMAGSVLVYFAARQFGWNLPAYPSGSWYFNPFTWQLLFISGAWFALGRPLKLAFLKSRTLLVIGSTCLLLSLEIGRAHV